MTLRIRLGRVDKFSKKNYHSRIVVVDSRKARDGRHIEVLGYYDPTKQPALLKVNLERADYWIKSGAKASDTVASLIKKAKQKSSE
ncbi:MAG: 30S ribosomal protein S16 [Candidatus Omnitrophota bacterium]